MQAKSAFHAATSLRPATFNVETTMRPRASTLLIHFVAGLALAIFLLPEGAPIVFASAVVVAMLKTVYDYLQEKVDVANPMALLGGAVVAVVVGSLI